MPALKFNPKPMKFILGLDIPEGYVIDELDKEDQGKLIRALRMNVYRIHREYRYTVYEGKCIDSAIKACWKDRERV